MTVPLMGSYEGTVAEIVIDINWFPMVICFRYVDAQHSLSIYFNFSDITVNQNITIDFLRITQHIE